jgi:hypothetical protein
MAEKFHFMEIFTAERRMDAASKHPLFAKILLLLQELKVETWI